MQVCRVCLSQEDQPYHSLFSVREDRTIAKTIMFCTGVKIKRRDGLSQLVCGTCADDFLKFFKLRKQCLDTDAFLRKSLLLETSETTSQDEPFNDKEIVYANSVQPESIIVIEEIQRLETEHETKPTVISNEWVIEEVEILKEEFEDMERLDDPDYDEPDSKIDSQIEKDTKPTLRLRKQRNSYKIPRKRKKVAAFDIELETSSKFVCCSCPSEMFESQQALDTHRMDHHEKYRIADNVIRPYECDVCFQRFLTEKHLQQHKTRPYKKREYVCTSCGNAFFASSTLKKHEEICAVTDRNYACDECGKRFTQVGSLRNHLKLHNSEKTHSCPICGKTFLKKFEVPIHMVTHTEEQPFPCDQCPARFKRKQALRNHQRHHSNPTPYKCDLCDEWFNNFSARKFHRQKVHEGIEPFKCDQCGASYGRKNRLDQHVKRAHAEDTKAVMNN
ncbi:zinc finger protein 99-like [Topomyia yanbarensis]|uniref:zinc finger protein 99-like n=1 Tax=Topomyia yanbarensis TaxID=2498891 RepID=UPI00273B2F63|nr:zinc finger protein 99-like [Topomyia yanbarensis]